METLDFDLYDIDNLKVAVVAKIRNDNKYLDEFINYYRGIGINHIYLYDNGFDDDEDPSSIVNKYNKEFVTLINKRNDTLEGRQNIYYNEAYNNYGDLYDYMCFFDVDEYLSFTHVDTIQKYILGNFPNADAIYINWLTYDDNNLIHYDPRPLKERFTRISYKAFLHLINYGVKSIVKTKLNIYFDNPHTPKYNDATDHVVYHGGCGDFINNITWCSYRYCYNLAHLKRYSSKTLEEYIDRKLKMDDHSFNDITYDLYSFFDVCEITEEKLLYIKNRGLPFDFVEFERKVK